VRTGLRELLSGLSALWMAAAFAATQSAAQEPQTTKEFIKSKPVVTVEELKGAVEYVEDDTLVVRMSTGELREFTVNPFRKFVIDGKELTVKQLKPGTTLTATIIVKTTPVTQRTTTIGAGTVWWVIGNTLIVTLPNGENRMYSVDDSYRFAVDGKPASVHELRKGMRISAEKIVEEPRSEIASETVVTGSFHSAGDSRR
jgi:hypothetical protein